MERCRSGSRRNSPWLSNATPLSITATVAPRPPGAPAASAIDQASGMPMPYWPMKFHCLRRKGSFGVNCAA